MSADGGAVTNGLQIVANLPDEVHWLCERTEPGPGGREIVCSEDESTRQESTLHALMLLSFVDQETNQNWLKGRVAAQLARCADCVAQFYFLKRKFYHQLLEEHDKENLDLFFGFLEEWDIERVAPVLQDIARDMSKASSVDSWYGKFQENKVQRNAVYECFCSPEILRDTNLRSCFTDICKTARVTAEGAARGLITFLFGEEELFRAVAELSWKTIGPDVKPQEFESHMLEALEESVRKAESEVVAEKLVPFWAGLATIVRNVSKEVITKTICGARYDPIKMAMNHISLRAPYLHSLLRFYESLMTKLGGEIWDVVSPLTSSTFADMLLVEDKYSELLRAVPQDKSGELRIVDLTKWMSSFVGSIRPLQRPTSATPLLRQLFKGDNLPPLSRGICWKEGMRVLSSTLSGVHSQSSTLEGEADRIILRQANELFNEHLNVVVQVATSLTEYEDEIMGFHMKIARTAAINTLISALKLDIKVVSTDYAMLTKKKPELPVTETTIRNQLWDSVCDKFPLDNVDYGCQMLLVLQDLIGLEKVYVSNPDPEDLKKRKERFNEIIDNLQRRLFKIFKMLSRFSPNNIKQVLSRDTAQFIFFAGMLSSVNDVSFAAEDGLLQAFGVEDKSEALRAMLKDDFRVTLTALSDLGRFLQRLQLFSLMPKMIGFSSTLLDVLCDRYDGVIVKQDLEDWQKTLLRIYWDIQWRWLGVIFKKVRKWAVSVDKEIMIEFTRDAMDYADNLFDRYWTFEQALRATMSEIEVKPGSHKEISWGVKLLQDASRTLHPLTVILTIQDPHLLSTCQALMSKILKLLDQQSVDISGDYFTTMRKYLYPQTLPEYHPASPPTTNLSEVQKAELSVAVSKIRSDFVPLEAKESTVVEISDDDYSDISDEEMLKAVEEVTQKKIVHKQAQLQFPTTTVRPADSARSYKPTVKSSTTTQLRTGPLRVGATKEVPRGPIPKEDVNNFLAKRKAAKAAEVAKKAALAAERAKKNATTVIEESSSDESSGDEGGNSLFKLGTTVQRSAKIVHNPKSGTGLKPRAQTNRIPGPIRRVKDNRARVAPDLSPLYKQILKWEAFHDDPFPPGLSKQDYTSIANSFTSYEAYRKTFEPLLLLEAWVGFQKSKEEAFPTALEVKLVSRMRADNFVELETTITGMDDRNRWGESDIIVLSASKNPLSSPDQPHCLARVHSINRKFTGAPISEVQLRCDPPPTMMQNHMRNGGTLHAVKIMGLVPLEREYSALMCLQYYDLEHEIISAKPAELDEPTDVQIKRTKYLYTVNEPQARAIISAIKNIGFTLIQGPPGTGKTKTVIGIVGALLTPTTSATTIAIPGAHSKPGPKPATKKILVCAPSNAAVDELVIRFKQGVRTTKGDVIIPTIVRIGRSDAINSTVKDVTLEELIEGRMAPTTENSNGKNTVMEELRKRHTELMEERTTKQAQLDDARSQKLEPPIGLQTEIDKLSATIREQRRALDAKRDQKKESSRNAEVLRRRVQQEIMDEAQIICATLSGSGHDMLRNVNVDFETVIIDEAAQSVELSALIPLKFGCDKCILVGDPKQLPPTVLSREAAKFAYEKSLFVRMQENYPQNVHLLSIQYRMHPMISAFPSKQFYDSELEDGEGMKELRTELWHNSEIFGPYRFFNVQGRESTGGRTSLINRLEIDMAFSLFDRLTKDFPEVDFDGKVGIITPYKQQLNELKRKFQRQYGDRIIDTIDFNTTDAFQGRERDIIIFSCVRASPEGGIGFLSDIRRMNVGLTRAKSSLYILGNAGSLVRNRLWGSLVQDAKARGLFTEDNAKTFAKPTRDRGGMSRLTISGGRCGGRPNQGQMSVGNAAPAPVQGMSVPDPMDIDKPEPSHKPQASHQPNPPGKHSHNQRDHSRVTCFACGKAGHRQIDCPQSRGNHVGHHKNPRGGGGGPRPPQSNTHDVRIPPIKTTTTGPSKPTQPPKRQHSYDGNADGESKRPHLAGSSTTVASSSKDPDRPKLPPKPPPKPMRKRDDDGGVFIKPKKRPRNRPMQRSSDVSTSDTKANANDSKTDDKN